MSSFTAATWEKTDLPPDDGRPIYRIKGAEGNGFVFHIGHEHSTLWVHVPEGFLTDGASIPSAVRWMVPKSVQELALKPAAVHDALCEHPAFDRLTADAIFLCALKAVGMPLMWRELFFRSVRYNKSKARRNPDELVLA